MRGQTVEAPNVDTMMPQIVRDLLKKRGLETPESIEKFLNPDYETGLADPFLLTDMDRAVTRIAEAVDKNETVAVYGDYDIDGIVATALMVETLSLHGLHALTYIPDRYKEGYGLHQSALEQLSRKGVTLLIAVDCGITNVEEVAWANQSGMDIIITDHHAVPPEIPDAVAVVNPKRPNDAYPFKELAGVAVAFALTRALQERRGVPEIGQEKWLLDLVALGTVCDVMPLIEENRVLVKYGLLVLRKTRRVGLVALAQSAGLELSELRSHNLAFGFGPRLNAAGRLEHANYSLELVLTKDPVEAQALAFQLEELNHQRQLEQERVVQEADAIAANHAQDPVLVLADTAWPHGIVGIAASKLAEKWQKPTLLLQVLDGVAKGSGRSAGGYNLIEGLRARADLFIRLGGHHFAAGFTLPVENIDELRQVLIANYREVEADLEPIAAQVEAEIDIDNATDITWELYDFLAQLEPFGNGNPEPVLGLNKLKIIDVGMVGKAKQHLKLRLASDAGGILQAIGFNLAEKYPNLKPGQLASVVCHLKRNDFEGRSDLQLVLLSIQ